MLYVLKLLKKSELKLYLYLNCKKYCKELKMLCFEMGNCCLNILYLDVIDYKLYEYEVELKNVNKIWLVGMLLWYNVNIVDVMWRWGIFIYRILFIIFCYIKFIVE